MAQLESKLGDRVPRESLFELGILVMSPAPSPPPLAVMEEQQHSATQHRHDRNDRKRDSMGGHRKKSSLVLQNYLGPDVAHKLEDHLWSRPTPLHTLKDHGVVLDEAAEEESMLKSRYWTLLREQREKYRDLERVGSANEMVLQQKLDAMTALSQQLSSELIHRHELWSSEKAELTAKVQRLREEQLEQQQRQQAITRELIKNKQLTDSDSPSKTGKLDENSKDTPKHRERQKTPLSLHFALPEGAGLDREQLARLEQRMSAMEANYNADLQRERAMHRTYSEQSERVKQTLVDEINKMEETHQAKLQRLEHEMDAAKAETRALSRRQQTQLQSVREEHRAEVEKERNIATIMVEDVNEEMERLRSECETKMARQKAQIRELRKVAEDAVSVGQRALGDSAEIERLRGEVREKERVQERYERMRQSKLKLEEQVMELTQQVIETFARVNVRR